MTYPQATTARSDEAGLSRYPGLGISFDAAIAAQNRSAAPLRTMNPDEKRVLRNKGKAERKARRHGG